MTKPSKEALAKARQMIDQWYSEEDVIFGEKALNGIAGLIQAMSDGVKRARSEQSPGAPLTRNIMRHIEQFILPDADPLADTLTELDTITGRTSRAEYAQWIRNGLAKRGYRIADILDRGDEPADESDIFGSIVNRGLMGWSDATGPFGDGSLHQDDFYAEREEEGDPIAKVIFIPPLNGQAEYTLRKGETLTVDGYAKKVTP